MKPKYKPIIIIGAPRSGTNMLRNILCSIDGVGTWPCDEINYIWRHGNINAESDEFTKSMASPKAIKYIKKQIDKLANSKNLNHVVEKTCANSLRVEFVNKVLPDAHYIFIYRNGLDVVASAHLRWEAKLDIPYLLKKVKYVPILDLPYYAMRYMWSHIYRIFSKEKHLAFWGPKLKNMKTLVKENTLDEVCALQWKKCIELSEKNLNQIPSKQVTKVRYEDFVCQPDIELTRICKEANITIDAKIVQQLVINVSDKSVHKWKEQINENTLKNLTPLIKDVMTKYNYSMYR